MGWVGVRAALFCVLANLGLNTVSLANELHCGEAVAVPTYMHFQAYDQKGQFIPGRVVEKGLKVWFYPMLDEVILLGTKRSAEDFDYAWEEGVEVHGQAFLLRLVGQMEDWKPPPTIQSRPKTHFTGP
ncbi:hypothetical protein K2X33_07240 [bacterium]|nr:hypothetical protein [bacterium]